MSPIADNTFHFVTDVHLVLSRAAHVSVLLGEVFDHGDQVKAGQAHAYHPLPLLEEENEAEEEDENKSKDSKEDDKNKDNDCSEIVAVECAVADDVVVI